MRRLLFLAVLITYNLLIKADILRGRVVDAGTNEPLEMARVEMTMRFLEVDHKEVMHLRTDTSGVFAIKLEGVAMQVSLKISYFGYKSANASAILNDDDLIVDVGTVALEPCIELLDEVVVDARIKRFHIKGDTVIFNPKAFNLEDGDRLIQLIQKLPGVSIRDGKLLWHGEPLKLMMNGKDALNESMMLSLVPIEAVDKLKAYDKATELEERTGVADGNEEHVLDISIKSAFMDKFYSTVEGRAYAGKEYAAQLDATRLSDQNPIMIYTRIANDPTKIDSRTNLGSNVSNSKLPVRQQVGTLSYRHLWSPDFDFKRDNRYDIMAGVNHKDVTQEGWSNQLDLTQGETLTEKSSKSYNYNHDLKIPIIFNSYFNLGEKLTLMVDANVSYTQDRKSHQNEQETKESGNLLSRINTLSNNSVAYTEGINTDAKAKLTRFFEGGSFAVNLRTSYSNIRSSGFSQGEYQYHQLDTNIIDSQRFIAPRQNLTAAIGFTANKTIGKDVMFFAMWETAFDKSQQDEQRWRNEQEDAYNSFWRNDNNLKNTLYMNANFNMGRFSVKPNLYISHRYEQLEYKRASLDTLAIRNTYSIHPSIEMHYRIRPQSILKSKLSYDSHYADLLDCISYTDDTNPLYVRKGNPYLKKSHSLHVDLLYTLMLAKHSQVLSIQVGYNKNIDPIGSVLYYNSNTGAYIEKKQNIRGGNTWNAKMSYERYLYQDLFIKNTISGNYDTRYGIMTIVDNSTRITNNRQSLLLLTDNLDLIYEKEKWNIQSLNSFNWTKSAYSNQSVKTQNIFNFSTELPACYKLNSWTFTLTPKYILNYGYVSQRMNGHQFLLNAQVDFKFMKNRAELSLLGNDLFNQQKNFYSYITANSHVEGGENILSRFVSLTFKYRFDPRINKTK